MKTLILIAAKSENGVIGHQGRIPWSLKEDMKHFRRTTMGHTLVMGRKTYESLPGHLGGRHTIVLTRQEGYVPKQPADLICGSLEEAVRRATTGLVFVCGGEAVYREAMPHAKQMWLTHVPGRYEGDAMFPDWDIHDWDILHEEEYKADDGSHAFSVVRYERRLTPAAFGV